MSSLLEFLLASRTSILDFRSFSVTEKKKHYKKKKAKFTDDGGTYAALASDHAAPQPVG
jgi:hypothetical protein